MNISFPRSAGLFLMLVGVCLSLGWVFMPAGLTAVWARFFAHVFLILSVVALQTDRRAICSKTMRVGAIMILIGSIGLSQLQGNTNLSQALTVQWTDSFQPYLLSLSACLFVGSTVYSAGGYHIDAISPWSKRIFLIALAWLLIGWPLTGHENSGQALVIMGFRTLNIIAYCWFGFEIVFRFRPDKFKYKWDETKQKHLKQSTLALFIQFIL